MITSDKPHATASGIYAVSSAPEGLTDAKRILQQHQRYGDIAIVFTLRDIIDSGQDLELNARPVFAQRPSSIAQLMPEERKEQLITDVVTQYG